MLWTHKHGQENFINCCFLYSLQKVPGPGMYEKTFQHPIPSSVASMGRQHGLFFTSAYQSWDICPSSGKQNSTCFIATTCVSGSLLYYVNSTAIISIDCIDRAVSFIHQTLTISWISEFARILTKVEDNLSNKGWNALMAWQSLVIGTDAVFRLFIFVLHLLWRVFKPCFVSNSYSLHSSRFLWGPG